MAEQLPAKANGGEFLPPARKSEFEGLEGFDVAENFEGVDVLTFPRITIAHQVGQFVLPDDSAVPRFHARVLDWHRANAYWATLPEERGGVEAVPPDCWSLDGLKPAPDVERPQAESCVARRGASGKTYAGCPLNEWGSAGDGSRGKACKNMVRLYLIVPGNALPVRLVLPPTSIRNWGNYLTSLANAQVPVRAVVTEFGLEKINTGSNVYSQVTFKRASEPCSIEEAKLLAAYLQELRPAMRGQQITLADYIEEASENTSDTETSSGEPFVDPNTGKPRF